MWNVKELPDFHFSHHVISLKWDKNNKTSIRYMLGATCISSVISSSLKHFQKEKKNMHFHYPKVVLFARCQFYHILIYMFLNIELNPFFVRAHRLPGPVQATLITRTIPNLKYEGYPSITHSLTPSTLAVGHWWWLAKDVCPSRCFQLHWLHSLCHLLVDLRRSSWGVLWIFLLVLVATWLALTPYTLLPLTMSCKC